MLQSMGHKESDTTELKLQQYIKQEITGKKLDSEKAKEPEIKLPTSVGSSKKQESSRKYILLLY